ncbi:membrane-spanning 4-domains subfamily A member 4A-like, partial [Clarias magur]
MASAPIPLTNIRSGYTIVTQVIPTSTAQSSAEQNTHETPSSWQKFLKGEPKALGAILITNGIWMFLLGVTGNIFSSFGLYNFIFWLSLFHIIAGSLSVAGSNKHKPCLVKGAMVLNILSAIAALISIIVLSINLFMQSNCYSYECRRHGTYLSYSTGVTGILLFFSLLQFTISISIAVFACKATCLNKPNLNIINVVADPEGCVALDNLFPAHQAQP